MGDVFHFGIFQWSMILVVAWLLILVLALPRFHEVLADFKVKPTGAMNGLLAARESVLNGGFVPLMLLPAALGFAWCALNPGKRRVLRRGVMLLFSLVVALTFWGTFHPLQLLVQGVPGSAR